MRPLHELINTAEPAMPLVQSWIKDAKCPVEVLSCTQAEGDRALLAAQVTTRSPMGAICHETGGILVDHGWLRILGAGCPRLPRALMAWNEGRVPLSPDGRPLVLLVADDVIGGFFAMNGGGLPDVEPGHVAYLAPDTLNWESLGVNYSQFLCWSWSGRMDGFYGDQRWSGWQAEISDLDGDKAIGIYPFLWAEGPPIGERHRGVVPIAETWALTVDVRKQFGKGDQLRLGGAARL